jgi:hypothetical protein
MNRTANPGYRTATAAELADHDARAARAPVPSWANPPQRATGLTGRQREFVERARELAAVEGTEDLRAYYAGDPMATGTETEASAFGSAQFLLEQLLKIIDGR